MVIKKRYFSSLKDIFVIYKDQKRKKKSNTIIGSSLLVTGIGLFLVNIFTGYAKYFGDFSILLGILFISQIFDFSCILKLVKEYWNPMNIIEIDDTKLHVFYGNDKENMLWNEIEKYFENKSYFFFSNGQKAIKILKARMTDQELDEIRTMITEKGIERLDFQINDSPEIGIEMARNDMRFIK